MRRNAAYTCWLLTLLLATLALTSKPAHAARMVWQDAECWQTAQFPSEAYSCEKPGAGYLETHVVEDKSGVEDLKLTKSGQYCSYEGMGSLAKEGGEWYATPTPHSSYEQGNGHESVCAAWSPSSGYVRWGLQLNNDPHPPERLSPYQCEGPELKERCGIAHYYSSAAQGLNNRPWSSYFGEPILKVEDPIKTNTVRGFQPGEKGYGVGYLCPVVEDAKSGDIIELCYEEWFGAGPKSVGPQWQYPHVGQCFDTIKGGFAHNHDKIVIPVKESTNPTQFLWNTFTEPLTESEYPVETGLKPELTSSNMKEFAELDNKEFKTTTLAGGYPKEPEITDGCGRSAATSAAEWALIGVKQGIEEWETGEVESGRSRSGLASTVVEPAYTWTSFNPLPVAITAESASKLTETEATVTGELNPEGFATSYAIEYGTNSVGEHVTTETPIGGGTSRVPISSTLTGLGASSTYKYRIRAVHTSVGGVYYGPEQTFSTTGKPSAETLPASGINGAEARLNGSVNPRGNESKFFFEYGTTKEKYEHKTAEASAGAGTIEVEVNKIVTGLSLETTYYYRIVATNSKGTTDGHERSFTAVGVPKNTVLPAITPTTPNQGVPATATSGTWSGKPTYAYQWERCNGTGGECSAIAGATTAAYTPAEADLTHTLVVKVTARNVAGESSALSAATSAVKPAGEITEYALLPKKGDTLVAEGSDGDLWVVWAYGYKVVPKIQKVSPTGSILGEYALPERSKPTCIVLGSEGSLWFSDEDLEKIGKITTSGVITEYALPEGSDPRCIAVGSDGKLWFTEYGSNKIGTMTTAGVISHEYTLATASFPYGITAGPGGGLWFTDWGTKKISKITMEGTVTEYAMPAGSESSEEPRQIAAGPSETLWFLFGERGGVDKLTTTGVFTPVNEPTLGASATSLTLGPDGNMWISGSSEVGGVASYWIDRVTPSNTITKFGTSENSQPHSVTPGPESDLWFTSYGTGELGKITP